MLINPLTFPMGVALRLPRAKFVPKNLVEFIASRFPVMAMSNDSFNFSLLKLFSFGFSKSDSQIKINEGETILLRYWSWKKLGYIRKAYTLMKGKITMQRLP